MKLAYADPPYLGRGSYYGYPEWDRVERHGQLIDELVEGFPDGWAMSLTSSSLRVILPLCPDDCRVAAWVRPRAEPIPGIRPIYSWEPVIFRGGAAGRSRDFVSASSDRTGEIVGAKPIAFCRWVLDLLGYQADRDELVDLFPGSGIMGRVARQLSVVQL